MERALDPELLRAAIGDLPRLPTVEELADALGEAEIELLAGRTPPVEKLLTTGWFLFGVGSSHAALEHYGLPRVRAAFRVAAHIFDLALQRADLDHQSRLEFCFAAQLAALRSEIAPNAMALYRREFPNGPGRAEMLAGAPDLALRTGVAVLGMDMGYVLAATRGLSAQVRQQVDTWGVANISDTVFGAALGTSLGCRDMVVFLLYGDQARLNRARVRLEQAVTSEASAGDRSSRWVAAQLLDLIDGLQTASIWTALPPDVPPSVRRAFVLTQPPIAQLWPPQVGLFGMRSLGGAHPLAATARRQLISTPTSGGKTLFAQLLIANHLATVGTGVCYVAPTRSLCYEVRASLDRRIRHLGSSTRADLPIGVSAEFAELFDGGDAAGVEVMTPERLAHLLRTDPQSVLERFGLFVIDEVHNVADRARGWTLESSVAYLHRATVGTAHRLVLISAAIGNRNHFVQWLQSGEQGGDVIAFHSDWRGPRRLHCLWTAEAQRNLAVYEPAERGRQARRRVPIHGVLSIRPTATGRVRHLQTTDVIGQLVLRRNKERKWIRDLESTAFYRMTVPLVEILMAQGPVLVIEVTRPRTVRMAQVLAERFPVREAGRLQGTIDLTVARLGAAHPLARTLRHGVAYHHGSLPLEVRTSIEEAVSAGLIPCLVATTTLTDGVNLPVRSVVIAAQGIRTGDEFNEFITGPKLLNAVGRAGRAAKETEGVVVLARQAEFDQEDFNRLRPDDAALHVTSSMATEQALAELAALEALLAQAEDAVFEAAGDFVPRFLSFIWFVAAALDNVGQDVTADAANGVLASTLGWGQLPQQHQERWAAVAAATVARYLQTEEAPRRRWASVGATLGSARQLETLAAEIEASLPHGATFTNPAEVVGILLSGDRLDRLLELSEAPQRTLHYRRAGANRGALAVPLAELLRRWVEGAELTTLSATYLAEIEDIDFRFEQLGDLINDYCETFLPWVFGTLVEWVNHQRESAFEPPPFPTEVAAYVRYGVSTPAALELAVSGVRSRRLCTAVGASWAAEVAQGEEGNLKSWLSSMTVADWRQRFGASTAELRSLVEYSRERRSGVAEALLTGAIAEVPLEPRIDHHARGPAVIRVGSPDEVNEVEVFSGDVIVGAIPARWWPDVQVLLDSGISFAAEVEVLEGAARLLLQPQELPEEA